MLPLTNVYRTLCVIGRGNIIPSRKKFRPSDANRRLLHTSWRTMGEKE